MNAATLRRAGLRCTDPAVYLYGATAQPGWVAVDSRGCRYWLSREIPEGILCTHAEGPAFEKPILFPWGDV